MRNRQGQKGTAVSFQTPMEFKIPRVQVEPPLNQTKHMVPESGYGWSENKWDGPWDMPATYMVPKGREPGIITTSNEDRMYGTVKGQYPGHCAR